MLRFDANVNIFHTCLDPCGYMKLAYQSSLSGLETLGCCTNSSMKYSKVQLWVELLAEHNVPFFYYIFVTVTWRVRARVRFGKKLNTSNHSSDDYFASSKPLFFRFVFYFFAKASVVGLARPTSNLCCGSWLGRTISSRPHVLLGFVVSGFYSGWNWLLVSGVVV
jgi:hypothetical protein